MSNSFRVYQAKDFGTAIQHFRTEEGLTQVSLAEQSGVYRSYLSSLEQGHTTETLERILNVLKVLGLRVTIAKEPW